MEGLPTYLADAPSDVCITFVQLYLANRALHAHDRDTLQIVEQRTPTYTRELGTMIQTVAGSGVTISDHRITISADAVRDLGFGRDGSLRA